MQKKFSKKEKTALGWTVFLILLICIFVSAYRTISANGNHITTAVVEYTTVRESVDAPGLVIRNETLVQKSGGDYECLLVHNGDRVAVRDMLSVSFTAEDRVRAYRSASEIDELVARFQGVLSSKSRNSDLSSVNEALFESLSALAEGQSRGRMNTDAASAAGDALTARKYILTDYDLSGRIRTLQKEADALRLQAGTGRYVRAAKAGYFSTVLDGLEKTLPPKSNETITTDQLRELLDAPSTAQPGYIGRIVSGFRWYYAALLRESDCASLREGGEYTVSFQDFSVPATLTRMGTEQNGQVACVFTATSCIDRVSSDRKWSAEIVMKEYSGYLIPKSAVRFWEGKQGVFVIRGQRCVFKPIEIILEKDNYYIIVADLSDNSGVYLNDTLVLSGKNLTDGMVINQ